MGNEFHRESATRTEDMPHEFAQQQKAPECDICQALPSDLRHVAWEREALASRERAAEGFGREIGS